MNNSRWERKKEGNRNRIKKVESKWTAMKKRAGLSDEEANCKWRCSSNDKAKKILLLGDVDVDVNDVDDDDECEKDLKIKIILMIMWEEWEEVEKKIKKKKKKKRIKKENKVWFDNWKWLAK